MSIVDGVRWVCKEGAKVGVPNRMLSFGFVGGLLRKVRFWLVTSLYAAD